MSMSKVNRAFSQALGDKGSSHGCIMIWETGEDNVQRQRLTCRVTRSDGYETIATGLFEGQADLVAAAEQLAKDFPGA
jgi:hypothetical protein